MTDWQPGDLALCVRGGILLKTYLHPLPAYPESGKLYNVVDIDFQEFTYTQDKKVVALVFSDAPVNRCGTKTWAAARFVKVTPDADIEGKEVERKVPKPQQIQIDEGIRA